MKIDDYEIQLAKKALAKMREHTICKLIDPRLLSPEDRDLAKRYPKSTLAQAREIAATPRESWEGYTSGFDKILYQEQNGTAHISGDHT